MRQTLNQIRSVNGSVRLDKKEPLLVANKHALVTLCVVLTVLLIEKFISGPVVYSTAKASSDVNWLTGFLAQHGKMISRTATLSLAIFIVLCFRQIKLIIDTYLNSVGKSQYAWLAGHLIVFFVFISLTPTLLTGTSGALSFTAWFFLLSVWLGTALLALANQHFWVFLAKRFGLFYLIAVFLSALVWWFGAATQSLWDSMSVATFTLVAFGLELLHNNVLIDITETQKIIGIEEFRVNIAPACSGYEGIGLITAFTAVYLYSFRKDFRFPMAYLIFPLAALVIWLFNALRIIVLINIGAYWSPDVAVWGFHSQAGWMTFIVTSVLVMWVAHHVPLFSSHRDQVKTKNPMNLATATLIPLVTLLALTLLTQALSAKFDWLYPLRVVCTATAIVLCWRALQLFPIKLSHWSISGGLVVFVLWLLLVPNSPESDQIHADALTNASQTAAWFWLVFRFIGTAITVPIAEELGFRAYLLCKLAGKEVETTGRLPFSWIGFIGSSLAFGFLHGVWVAGILAGACYAIVRYKSQHVADAIVAHSITNALLFAYACYTGYWSVM